MKCFNHSASEAVAVCAFCGKGLCRDCLRSPPLAAARIICSAECEAALRQKDETLSQIAAINQQLLQKSAQNARASAFYCYLCGGLSAAAAVVAWFMLPSPFLILFTAGCSVALLLSGYWYGRTARRTS